MTACRSRVKAAKYSLTPPSWIDGGRHAWWVRRLKTPRWLRTATRLRRPPCLSRPRPVPCRDDCSFSPSWGGWLSGPRRMGLERLAPRGTSPGLHATDPGRPPQVRTNGYGWKADLLWGGDRPEIGSRFRSRHRRPGYGVGPADGIAGGDG